MLDDKDTSVAGNMLYVLATTQQLIPVMKLPKDEPLIITIIPSTKIEDEIDLLNDPKYL